MSEREELAVVPISVMETVYRIDEDGVTEVGQEFVGLGFALVPAAWLDEAQPSGEEGGS
jgi:hypothetical protein